MPEIAINGLRKNEALCRHCKQPTTCLSQAFAYKSKQILLVSKVLIIYCLLCATEKSYQQLGLRVSSGYPNTSKPYKHDAAGRVHSSVSRFWIP